MDKETVLEYLNTDEGKAIVEELKQPLLSKRDEILGEKKEVETKLNALLQAEQERESATQAAAREAKEAKLKEENDFEAFKQHMQEQVIEKEKALQTFQTRMARTEVDRLISETAFKHSNSPKPLQLLLKERIESTVLEDGTVDYVVKDTDGNTLYWEGKPARMNHLVESLKTEDDYAVFFSATGVSGSGTKQTEPMTQGSYKDMSSTDFNLSKAMGNKI